MPNKLAWDLLHDFQVIIGIGKDFPEDSVRGSQALYTANRIMNVFSAGDDRSIVEALKISREFLNAKNGDAQHEVYAVGHCHIGILHIYLCYNEANRIRHWLAMAV